MLFMRESAISLLFFFYGKIKKKSTFDKSLVFLLLFLAS